MVTCLTLRIQGLAICRPGHAQQVDVRVGSQVDANRSATGDFLDKQVDDGVGAAGAGKSLGDESGARCANLQAFDQVDGVLVYARIGYGALVWVPPIAGVAGEFLLRHEFSCGVTNGAVGLWRQGEGLPLERGRDEQRSLADEAQPFPGRRQPCIRDVEAIVQRQSTMDLAGVAADEEEIASDRYKDALTFLVPFVVNDSGLLNALPFAPRDFGIGQVAAGERRCVDKLVVRQFPICGANPEIQD